MKFQLDTLLETLGKPGKYQLGIFFLLACNYFPLVFNIVIMGFFGYSPKHSCVSDIYGQSGRNGSAVNGSLAPRLDACSSTYFLSGGINKTVTCANDPNSHWEFYTEEREATIVSEWSLVCESKYLSKLAATIYFCGVMVGGLLFGYLADKYGRKPVMLVTLYTPILIGLGTAFSNNYYLYVALRFFMGMFLQGLQTTSYVLVMEMFLPRYRGVAGAMLEVFWGIAVLLVAPIAYLLQNWRYMQLAISLPSILAIAYIWLTPESLRWMILQKKMEPAKALVQKISKFNGLPYPTEQMDAINSHNKISTEAARQFSFFDLLQTREMRKRSLILFYLWQVCGCCGILCSATEHDQSERKPLPDVLHQCTGGHGCLHCSGLHCQKVPEKNSFTGVLCNWRSCLYHCGHNSIYLGRQESARGDRHGFCHYWKIWSQWSI